MTAAGASGGADGVVVNGSPRQMRIQAGYRAIDGKVTLIHGGEMCELPLEVAIDLRDALSRAIAIPERARALSAAE